MKNICRVLFCIMPFAMMAFTFRVQAQVTLNLKFFIQGYYINGGQMTPVLSNELVAGATFNEVDTVTVELHDTILPYTVAATFTGVLLTNGTLASSFSNSVSGNSYYIGIKHRNSAQTWSALPVSMSAITNYDFSTSSSQAFGNKEIQMQAGIFAFYSGDINQDQNIDLIDFPPLDYATNHGLTGYNSSDLNGDGNVDLFDFIILRNNF